MDCVGGGYGYVVKPGYHHALCAVDACRNNWGRASHPSNVDAGTFAVANLVVTRGTRNQAARLEVSLHEAPVQAGLSKKTLRFFLYARVPPGSPPLLIIDWS